MASSLFFVNIFSERVLLLLAYPSTSDGIHTGPGLVADVLGVGQQHDDLALHVRVGHGQFVVGSLEDLTRVRGIEELARVDHDRAVATSTV